MDADGVAPGHYRVNDILLGRERQEEGHIRPQTAVQFPPVEDRSPTLRADEVVLRWDGRTIGMPFADPARMLARPGDLPGRRAEADPRMPYRFTWEFEPAADPGAPELTFGQRYQLRARVVDLAGGCREPEPFSGDGASTLRTFARYEPVPPPAVPPPDGLVAAVERRRPTDVLGPRGAHDVLVVRSDPAGDPGRPVASYPAGETRLVLPPAAPFSVVSYHGLLSGHGADVTRNARRSLLPPRASAIARSRRHYSWLPDPAAAGVAAAVLPPVGRRGDACCRAERLALGQRGG